MNCELTVGYCHISLEPGLGMLVIYTCKNQVHWSMIYIFPWGQASKIKPSWRTRQKKIVSVVHKIFGNDLSLLRLTFWHNNFCYPFFGATDWLFWETFSKANKTSACLFWHSGDSLSSMILCKASIKPSFVNIFHYLTSSFAMIILTLSRFTTRARSLQSKTWSFHEIKKARCSTVILLAAW